MEIHASEGQDVGVDYRPNQGKLSVPLSIFLLLLCMLVISVFSYFSKDHSCSMLFGILLLFDSSAAAINSQHFLGSSKLSKPE